MSGQKINTITYSKYLGVIFVDNLSFHAYLNIIKYKLNRTTHGILAKPSHYIANNLLKKIYCSVFDSHTRYAGQVWSQSKSQLLTQIIYKRTVFLSMINCKKKPLNHY